MSAIEQSVLSRFGIAAPRTHVPRDETERPLVGLCGYVAASADIQPRDSDPGEWPSCVVCDDLWRHGALT